MSKVIYNNIIPVNGFYAINLFGIIFVRKGLGKISKTTVNHEDIHTAQMKELYYIGFYVLYFLEWIYRLIKHGTKNKEAYYNISFEAEAYDNQYDYKYLTYRPKYNFKKYFK